MAKGAASDDEGAAAVAEPPASAEPPAKPEPAAGVKVDPPAAADGDSKLPIKMLNDRILVQIEGADGERRSSGGILIPATAQVGKRLAWAVVVAVGSSVRSMELDDRVLFNPEDRYEVEVGGRDYIILRERDIHAVAAKRLDPSHTGLYL
jgi:chaperonin GroES